MYVTRPMSRYKNSPTDLSLPPPEGPNSGILVVQDEQPTSCFGGFNTDIIKALPLPQNKHLELYYATGFYPNRDLQFHKIMFIPVLGQPLSSNRYYAVYPYGKDRGEGYTSSKVEDVEMDTCCFDSCGNNVLPQRFDPKNQYQQYEINYHRKIINVAGGFVAKSMAKDGFPPEALWRRGWKLINSSTLPAFEIGEALGLDAALRARLPDFEFPLKPMVVGKWYCPFIFVREETPKNMKDIRNRSMYYEMTLEQRWEQVFAKDRSDQHDQGNAVVVDAVVKSEVVMVAGREAVSDERNAADDGVVWFRSLNNAGEETRVGLSLAIVERMKWEQGRVGWVRGDEGQVRVQRAEEFGGIGKWKKFGCFALVERFVLNRMDGSLVLTHDFKYTHHIRSKWE